MTEGNFHQLVALLHCRGLHKVNPLPPPNFFSHGESREPLPRPTELPPSSPWTPAIAPEDISVSSVYMIYLSYIYSLPVVHLPIKHYPYSFPPPSLSPLQLPHSSLGPHPTLPVHSCHLFLPCLLSSLLPPASPSLLEATAQ